MEECDEELPIVFDCHIGNWNEKLLFVGYTEGRDIDEVEFILKDIKSLKDAIFWREVIDESYKLVYDEKFESMSLDEIHTKFKPIAMKLFEHFYDHKTCTYADKYDDMPDTELRKRFNTDLEYVSDRWGPERLNRILEQLFILFKNRDKIAD